MTLSIVTVCYNAASTIADAVQSVLDQALPEGWKLEYIVVDGASTDGTLEAVSALDANALHIISEPDRGLYDAMNKGIVATSGDIVGILNADDMHAQPHVLSGVIRAFEQSGADGVYGDLNYVDAEDPSKVVRRWTAGRYEPGAFRKGWMPPHPTLFLKRSCYERMGLFNLSLRSAADYELMLRMIHRHHITLEYLPETLVHMRVGGTSNASLRNRLRAHREDWEAWRLNGFTPSPFTMLAKPLRKLPQFLTRR